jgi:hypothetical protein
MRIQSHKLPSPGKFRDLSTARHPLQVERDTKGNLPICEDFIYTYRSAGLHIIPDVRDGDMLERPRGKSIARWLHAPEFPERRIRSVDDRTKTRR